jgi:hypothetical protein
MPGALSVIFVHRGDAGENLLKDLPTACGRPLMEAFRTPGRQHITPCGQAQETIDKTVFATAQH